MGEDKGVDKMYNKELTPKIEDVTFHPDNHNSFGLEIRDAHVDLSSSCYGFAVGNHSYFTVYGLQESDFLKIAQACIDAANELRNQPVKVE
jgi:hypothetical protein